MAVPVPLYVLETAVDRSPILLNINLYFRDLSVDVKESIVIARYGGRIGEGEKAANAQLEGAVGVLLYPDPDDVAREGQNGRNVAPNTRWLPGGQVT